MSTQKGHKRKRSIQDTPVDLTKMQLARQRLSALQEELSGIEETETEMEEIMKHLDALQGILGSTKKLVS
jgi:predicted component of type VI protein secretion system